MRALSEQLKAEIRVAGKSIRSVAGELGIDYSTYRRWVLNENPIRMATVFETLAVIGVTPEVFFKRVDERASSLSKD